MEPSTLAELSTGPGRALLEDATGSYGVEDEFALGSRLRRRHAPELVAAALTQARLRHRAAAKFAPADAARMFFTVDGYEQATRQRVAAHRARRLAATLPDRAAVADLCCGIGGDLVELARAGLMATGIEADPPTAAIARANLGALGLTDRARVLDGDATTIDRSAYAAIVCDPARRGGGPGRGRVFDPDRYRPPWSFVQDLLTGAAVVKIAPGIPHDRVPPGVEAEWVSDAGEVKEAALWSGRLATPGVRRRATLLPAAATLTDADAPTPGAAGPPGRYLYEPDGAVIRAGLVTAVAAAVDGWLLDPTIAYVSANTLRPTPFARTYAIADVLPYDVKALRRYLRDHGIGNVTVKKRGVGIEPESLRRSLRPAGPARATLVVTRVSRQARVLVVDPL